MAGCLPRWPRASSRSWWRLWPARPWEGSPRPRRASRHRRAPGDPSATAPCETAPTRRRADAPRERPRTGGPRSATGPGTGPGEMRSATARPVAPAPPGEPGGTAPESPAPLPNVQVPGVEEPVVELPDVKLPDVNVPDVNVPGIGGRGAAGASGRKCRLGARCRGSRCRGDQERPGVQGTMRTRRAGGGDCRARARVPLRARPADRSRPSSRPRSRKLQATLFPHPSRTWWRTLRLLPYGTRCGALWAEPTSQPAPCRRAGRPLSRDRRARLPVTGASRRRAGAAATGSGPRARARPLRVVRGMRPAGPGAAAPNRHANVHAQASAPGPRRPRMRRVPWPARSRTSSRSCRRSSGSHLDVLLALAAALGVRAFVERRRARDLERDRQRLMRDVGALERALLPAVPETLGALAISVAHRASEGPAAGGDFYDAFELGGGRVAVLVGDVSGHGPDALERTNSLRAALHACLQAGLTPRAALESVGRSAGSGSSGQFVTAVVAVHDPADGHVHLRDGRTPAPHPCRTRRARAPDDGFVAADGPGAPHRTSRDDGSASRRHGRLPLHGRAARGSHVR